MAMPTVLPDHEVLYAQARAEGYTTAAQHARTIGCRVNTLQKALSEKPWGPGLKAIYVENQRAQTGERRQQVAEAEQRVDRARLENPDPDDEITIGVEVPAAERERLDPDDPAVRDMVEQFAKDRGIPLDKWVPVEVNARRYPLQLGEGQILPDSNYLSVKFKPVTGRVVFEVVDRRPPRKVTPIRPRRGEPTLVLLTSCAQAPFHDPRVHELQLGFLAMVQPHRAADLGDLRDNPDVSRYEKNPAYRARVKTVNRVAGQLVIDRCEASPGTVWDYVEGNHDARLEAFILKKAGEVHDVCRWGADRPWHDARELLPFDEYGITWHPQKGGQWQRSMIRYSESFAAIHGWKTAKGTGARDTAYHMGMHIAQGHTHRQTISPVTRGEHGDGRLFQAVEVGCTCLVDEGLGHTNGVADWQQGWALASLWPDGPPTFELVQVVDGALRFRGARYTARQLKVAA